MGVNRDFFYAKTTERLFETLESLQILDERPEWDQILFHVEDLDIRRTNKLLSDLIEVLKNER
jgi:hypothetical protein